MEKLRAGFSFIFSSYKRTAAILFIGALTLAIPLTLNLVGKQQDIRQRAGYCIDVDDPNCTGFPPVSENPCDYLGQESPECLDLRGFCELVPTDPSCQPAPASGDTTGGYIPPTSDGGQTQPPPDTSEPIPQPTQSAIDAYCSAFSTQTGASCSASGGGCACDYPDPIAPTPGSGEVILPNYGDYTGYLTPTPYSGYNYPTPTSGGGNTAPTPTKTPTPTVRPDGNTVPTNTPVPSSTAKIDLNLKLIGIGIDLQRGQNAHPARAERLAEVMVFNSQNQKVAETKGNVVFDPQTGLYKGSIALGNIPSGTYLVKVRVDNALWKYIPGILSFAAGTTTNGPVTTLILGDLNQDNEINLIDYTLLISCLQDSQCRNSTTGKIQVEEVMYAFKASVSGRYGD